MICQKAKLILVSSSSFGSLGAEDDQGAHMMAWRKWPDSSKHPTALGAWEKPAGDEKQELRHYGTSPRLKGSTAHLGS